MARPSHLSAHITVGLCYAKGPTMASPSPFECRNCKAHESRALYAEVPDRFHGFAGEFSYVTCSACGLVQLEHIPANPGEFYAGYRIHAGDSPVYRALRRLTIGHCYLERPGHGMSLLDIGCGNGFYIKEMSKRGWNAVGYEFDPEYATALSAELGLPVLAGERALEEHRAEFDLVTFNFSFEHLDQPLRFLELVTQCLRPGGEIYISVPNIESREAAIFKDRWFHLDPPRHISFFTKELLRTKLESIGFGAIEIKNLPVPTGFAGSMSYRLWDRFRPLTWYAAIVPGMLFSTVVRDGNFAISGRRAS
jgi:SAM-dependent methyltransferase